MIAPITSPGKFHFVAHIRDTPEVYKDIGVQPVFLDQEQAIDYAIGRASFRSG